MLYRFDRVRKSYGPKEVLRETTWQHNPGEKVGLVGKNGAGKTTLLRIALGREEPDAGQFVKANAVRIATVEQALEGDFQETVHDYAAGAFAHLHAIEADMRRLEHAMAEGDSSRALHDRYDALAHRFENEGGYDMVAEVDKALSGLGFAKADFGKRLAEISGGQKNRAMLARAILSSPDVLLLDEPTNHLRVVSDLSLLPQPKERIPAISPRSGYVRAIATEKMGFLSIDIGCGRRRREDEIDPAAGFLVEKTVGDRVEMGEPLAWLCLGDRQPPRPNMERELAALFQVGDEKQDPPPLAIEKL